MKMNIGKVLLSAAMLAGFTAPAIAQDWDNHNRYDQRWDTDRARYDQRWDDDRARYAPRRDNVDWRERRNDRAIETRILNDWRLRREAFRNFDRNRDGRLEPFERRKVVRYFERIADTNRDGLVSGSEFDRARARVLNRAYAYRW